MPIEFRLFRQWVPAVEPTILSVPNDGFTVRPTYAVLYDLPWRRAGLAASLVVVAAMLFVTHLSISFLAAANAKYLVLLLMLLAIRFQCRAPTSPWQRVARDGSEFVGTFIFIALAGAVASYPVAVYSTGFSDQWLARGDHFFHFDWLAWYRVVSTSYGLQLAGRIFYANIYFSPLLLLLYFAVADRKAEAHEFLTRFWVAAIITLILFVRMPAVGPLAYLWKGPIPYMPTSALYQLHLLPALRDHQFHAINLGDLQGLVCAPSFHATCAVLFTAAGWKTGSLRWPLLSLNLAMLVATPIEGTHYLVDIIAGIGVALLAILIMHIPRKLGWIGNR